MIGIAVWWYGTDMGTKMTFVLDDDTVGRLQRASSTLAFSKSRVVREAILEYSERIGRLSERERLAMLRVLDDYFARPGARDSRAVDRELRALRAARRAGGRRTPEGQTE